MFYFKLKRLLDRKSATLVLVVAVFYSFVPATTNASLVKRVFLTSGTSWTVPADFSTSSNTIEAIGSGGDGRPSAGMGGGGGAYAAKTNQNISGTITYQIGVGSTDTVFNSSATTCAGSPTPTVCADGGADAPSNFTNGTGGTTANSIGDTEFAGGNGGGGGGGGAAGPAGAGANGSGGDGGASGGGGSGATQAVYDTEGGFCIPGTAAESAYEWAHIPSYGSGGGGAKAVQVVGTSNDCNGVSPASYGGGGGGGTSEIAGTNGANGLIVITYASTEAGASSVARIKIQGGSVKIIGGQVIIR